MNARKVLATLLLAGTLAMLPGPDRAYALTITRTFIPPGGTFPVNGGTAGDAPTNLVGGGNLVGVFSAAADWWELAIHDPHALEIGFGWSPLGGLTLAITTQFVNPQPPTIGKIELDNDGSSLFFMDPTPYENSEFTTFSQPFDNLGAGEVNIGRLYGGAIGPAAQGVDMLTVATHEIGHLLGINGLVHGSIRITPPRPYAGTRIPTTGDGHIRIDTALMSATVGIGMRRLGSWVDILAATENSDWVDLNLDPVLSLPGDLNGDSFVGQTDLDIVLAQWGRSTPLDDPRADPSGDGFVGQTDLDTVLSYWGKGSMPMGYQHAPEPASLLLLAIGVLALVGRRPR